MNSLFLFSSLFRMCDYYCLCAHINNTTFPFVLSSCFGLSNALSNWLFNIFYCVYAFHLFQKKKRSLLHNHSGMFDIIIIIIVWKIIDKYKYLQIANVLSNADHTIFHLIDGHQTVKDFIFRHSVLHLNPTINFLKKRKKLFCVLAQI